MYLGGEHNFTQVRKCHQTDEDILFRIKVASVRPKQIRYRLSAEFRFGRNEKSAFGIGFGIG